MPLVWQEAACLTLEANVTGLKGVRFSSVPASQYGHCKGCLLLVCSASKKLSSFYVG